MTYPEKQAMTKTVNSTPEIKALKEDIKELEEKQEKMYEELDQWTAKDLQKEQNIFMQMDVLQEQLDKLKG